MSSISCNSFNQKDNRENSLYYERSFKKFVIESSFILIFIKNKLKCYKNIYPGLLGPDGLKFPGLIRAVSGFKSRGLCGPTDDIDILLLSKLNPETKKKIKFISSELYTPFILLIFIFVSYSMLRTRVVFPSRNFFRRRTITRNKEQEIAFNANYRQFLMLREKRIYYATGASRLVSFLKR